LTVVLGAAVAGDEYELVKQLVVNLPFHKLMHVVCCLAQLHHFTHAACLTLLLNIYRRQYCAKHPVKIATAHLHKAEAAQTSYSLVSEAAAFADSRAASLYMLPLFTKLHD
jgi:hypothetical protein